MREKTKQTTTYDFRKL